MAQKKPTKDDMLRELVMLDQVTNALNTAMVAMFYIAKVKGNELDKVDTDEYVKYCEEHVHPLMKRADEIVRDAALKAKKAVEEAKEPINE